MSAASLRSELFDQGQEVLTALVEQRQQVLPDDRTKQRVRLARCGSADEQRHRVHAGELAGRDGDLQAHLRRWVACQFRDALAHGRLDATEVAGRPHAPGAEARVRRRQQFQVQGRFDLTGADEGPDCVHARLRGAVSSRTRLLRRRRPSVVLRSASRRWARSRK